MINDKPKYLFISNMASPYQIKFCAALEEYFDTEFWFYTYREDNRPKWWEIPLNAKCKIIKDAKKLPRIKGLPDLGYYSFKMVKEIKAFKPDIIVLGGCMLWHAYIMIVAHSIGAKVAIATEAPRLMTSEDQATPELLTRKNARLTLMITKLLFGQVDLLIGMGNAVKDQFIKEFRFAKEKVVNLPYPQDIIAYYNHPLRIKHIGDTITILFANRLVDRYQPLLALAVLKKLNEKYPNIKLLMNADGYLKQACITYIADNRLTNVEFLEDISSWDQMHLIYQRSDILIIPCTYSNGNGTIIEARASGMGVVMSDKINNSSHHSLPEENCFICNLNVDSFVDGVSRYLENPELLATHGSLSRKLVAYKRNDNVAKLYYDTFKKHGFISDQDKEAI